MVNLTVCRLGRKGVSTALTLHMADRQSHLWKQAHSSEEACWATVTLLACPVKGLSRCLHGCQPTTFHQWQLKIQNEKKASITVRLCSSTLFSLHHRWDAVEVLGRIQEPRPSPLSAHEGRVAGHEAHSSRLKGSILHQLPKEQQWGTAPNFSFLQF